MGGPVWSPEHVALIRELFGKRNGIVKLVGLTGRDAVAVRQKAIKLGLTPYAGWDARKDAHLIARYGREHPGIIARHLRMSKRQVYRRAHVLGITRERSYQWTEGARTQAIAMNAAGTPHKIIARHLDCTVSQLRAILYAKAT